MMKHILLKVFIGIAILLSTNVYATQLSGNYTIDSAGTASATVFKDFNSAIIYLTSSSARPDGGPANSSPFGVSGAVTFTVNAGTYLEQVNIPAITGTSATNTISFEGVNVSTCILEFTATSTTNAHVLRFNGSSFITVKNITIKNNGATAGLGVHFYSSIATFNITIKQCSVIVANTFTGTTGTANIKAIAATNATTSNTGGGTSGSAGVVYNIFVDSNYISGGNIGVFLSSSNSSAIPHNFYIRWNKIFNAFNEGIGASTTQGYRIEGNHIKLLPNAHANSAGMEHTNGSTSGTHSYIVINNIIENAAQYGIWFRSNNANSSLLYPTLVMNNYIMPTFTASTSFGINCSQARNHKFINNTILMNMANGIGIFSSGAQNPMPAAINNIIQLINPNATGLCISSDASNIDSCDYNVYTKNGTSQDIIRIQGTTYTKQNFKGAGGRNLNSTLDDPILISLSDPRPRNICQKGLPNGWMINLPDLFLLTRGNPPQIGCAEGTGGVAIDAAIIGFIKPVSYPVVSGSQDVEVIIKNSGSNTLTNLNVTVALGPFNFRTIAWTGTLLSCQIDTVRFTGGNQLTFASGSNLLRGWIDSPNFLVDSNATNDTIQKTFCTPLATGTYTIGATGNFATFSEVASILSCGGVSGTGPIVFEVANGTYNEQIELGSIAGLSESTPLIFQSASGIADSVLLQFNAGTGNNFIVRLSNQNYVRFKNMSFQSLNTAAGTIFDITGSSSFDTIENCKITGPNIASTATTMALVFANGISGKKIAFINNTFNNGSIGIYMYGTSLLIPVDSSAFINNTFNNAYYMTMMLSFHSNTKIRNNTINTNTVYTAHYGIYLINSANAIEISNNKLSGFIGGYGILLSSVNGTSVLNGLVQNNMVSGGTTSTFYGLYIQSSTFINVYHNSISSNTSAATSYAFYAGLTSTTSTSVIVRNNIFANNYGLGTTATIAAMYVGNSLYLNSNFNNYYSASTTLINLVNPATVITNIANWRNASTFDKNSVSYRPGFINNANNLSPNPLDSASWSINGQGMVLPLVNADINDVIRPANYADGVPDLGAVEFTPTAIPPMATPTSVATAGTSQAFLFAGDTVAKITYDAFYPVPAQVEVRAYPGARPLNIDTLANNFMFYYDSVYLTYGFYSLAFELYYKDIWVGKNPNETSLRLAEKTGINSWFAYSNTLSSVDTTNNIIKLPSAFMLGDYFTGTDNNSPLPVKLLDLTANKVRNTAVLNWLTSSELNSNYFEIEKAGNTFGNVKWSTIGKVNAAGNSSTIQKYNFVDELLYEPNAKETPMYYRLKMVDKDGSFEYSKIVSIMPQNGKNDIIQVFPNPFNKDLNIVINTDTKETYHIELMDISGKSILKDVFESGVNGTIYKNNNLEKLLPGVYLLSIESNGVLTTQKLVKQ